MRRLYSHGTGLKPHHHIRVNQEMKLDLEMWTAFLSHPSAFCRSFIDFSKNILSMEINFYLDTRGNIGMGPLCNKAWMYMAWDQEYLESHKATIQYWEMFALLAAVLSWIEQFENQCVTIFCDNQNVCNMVNDHSTSCKNCMVLVRIFLLHCLTKNVQVTVEYIECHNNDLADALLRGQIQYFKYKTRNRKMNVHPTPVPELLLPMEKLWIRC